MRRCGTCDSISDVGCAILTCDSIRWSALNANALVESNFVLWRLSERRKVFVLFIAFSKRSCWAEMECHLSLLEQRKIDRAKNDQSFTSLSTKTLTKFSKPLRQKFLAGQ